MNIFLSVNPKEVPRPPTRGMNSEDITFWLSESKSRRQRISIDDVVIFASYRYEPRRKRDLSFVSVARVLEVERSSTAEVMEHVLVTCSKPSKLSQNNTLHDLQFSLERVYSFLNPMIHFKDGTLISKVDAATILIGRIFVPRTIYYGLLNHLPSGWRRYFEQTSQYRQSFRDPIDVEQSSPVSELLELFEEIVVEPTILARDVQRLRHEIWSPDDSPTKRQGDQRPAVSLIAATEDGQHQWPLDGFLQHATSHPIIDFKNIRNAFKTSLSSDGWSEVLNTDSADHFLGDAARKKGPKWRIHHW